MRSRLRLYCHLRVMQDIYSPNWPNGENGQGRRRSHSHAEARGSALQESRAQEYIVISHQLQPRLFPLSPIGFGHTSMRRSTLPSALPAAALPPFQSDAGNKTMPSQSSVPRRDGTHRQDVLVLCCKRQSSSVFSLIGHFSSVYRQTGITHLSLSSLS